jgi:hypothetical protein
LTSNLFWKYQGQLLQASRADLPVIVKLIVSASNAVPAIPDWVIPPSPITKVLGRLFICLNSDLPYPLPSSMPGTTPANAQTAFLQITTGRHSLLSSRELPVAQTSSYLQIEAQGGKKGQLKFLQTVLPRSMAFISHHLDIGSAICICCDTGKDISIGVALAALQKYFDDNGRLIAREDRPGVLRTSYPFPSWLFELILRQHSREKIHKDAPPMDHIKSSTSQPVARDTQASERVSFDSCLIQPDDTCCPTTTFCNVRFISSCPEL